MNLKRIICTLYQSQLKGVQTSWLVLILVLIAVISISVQVFGEARNIYVGDIISLEVSSQQLSEEELRQKFQDFEIVRLTKESEGYSILLRTFQPGEYTVIIGDKELLITVASTLSDIERENVFEAEINMLEPGFIFHWRILLLIFCGIFAVSSGFAAFKAFRRKKAKPETPYEKFLRLSSALSEVEENYFVDLTFFFKEYIGAVYKCRIYGKTSGEIMAELKIMPIEGDILPIIENWLTQCDNFKFSGIVVCQDEKCEHKKKLIEIVNRINKNTHIKEETA